MTDSPDRIPDTDDDAAYRFVDAALREDPGYALPTGFADRATLHALRPRRRFDWFEHVLIPLLLAPPAVYVESILRDALQTMVPSLSDAVMRIVNAVPRLSIDGMLYAAGGMLLSAAADRLLGRRRAGRAHIGTVNRR